MEFSGSFGMTCQDLLACLIRDVNGETYKHSRIFYANGA